MRNGTMIRRLINCPKNRDFCGLVAGFALTFVVGDRLLDLARLPHVEESSNGVRWKWELYERSDPRPTVAFLGSSYGMFAINPYAVDEQAAALCGERPRSLNLCASAASAYTMYLLARRMVESGRLPELVYIEVSPESTVAVAHSWMESGLRALGDARDIPVAAAVNRRLLGEAFCATLFASYRQWKDCRLVAKLVLRGAPLRPVSKFRPDDNGWVEWVGKRQPARDRFAIQPNGVDFATFAGCNPNGDALENAVRLLRGAGVTVRFVEMPRHSNTPPAYHPQKNGVYRAFIDRAADELNVPLVRPADDVVADGDFFDHGHVNATGSEKVSRWLARDVAETMVALEHARSPTRIAASTGNNT